MSSPHRILWGLALGAIAGLVAHATAADAAWLRIAVEYVAQPIGQIFLRLLFVLVIPLLFSALVTGIGEIGIGQLGRLGGRMLGYTVVVSMIAVAIGITLVNIVGPGRGLSDEVRALASHGAPPPLPRADTSAIALLTAIIPDNPVKAAAQGDMIGVLAFSLLFGVGLARTRTPAADRLREMIQGLYDVSTRLIDMVLKLAPIGVAALVFAMTARLGTHLLGQLGAYVAVVLVGLALHMFVVYSISVRFFGGRDPRVFFRDIRLALVTAFSTASSNATLPTALKVAEENLKLPRSVARFVLTAGSTMNQNGTALFEGVTVLFLAQVFGVELSVAQQALVVAICILAGIGTAGVPAGSIPVIAMILGMFHIPPEGLGLILGVDRFLDMCRTTLNVGGDLAAAVYVARGERAEPPNPTS